ncbi:hypothetical protein IFO70_12935 [Phormidium tenue FACHB-886]|nr:hypothetical protein [Phormidium tenue FACHB-886]
MYSTQNTISTPQNVISVAKQILCQYTKRSITFSPYRLVEGKEQDSLLISTLDGRGIILIQRGNRVESNLKPCDYTWFSNKFLELEKVRELEKLKEVAKRTELSSLDENWRQPSVNPAKRRQQNAERLKADGLKASPQQSLRRELINRRTIIEDL